MKWEKLFSSNMYLSTICASYSHFPKLTGKTLKMIFFYLYTKGILIPLYKNKSQFS